MIAIMAAIAVIIHFLLGVWWAVPAYAALLFCCFVGRQFGRSTEAKPLIVLAPIDGVVEEIYQDTQHLFIEGAVQRIRIRQHTLGEFVLHSPIEGKVLERWWPDKAGSGAKNFGFIVQADEGDRCAVDVVNAMRPRFKTHFFPAGYRTRQGQRCGLIGIGVLSDVYVAAGTLIKVQPGDKVRAGTDIIASFQPHHQGVV